jgi:hypothetical protein
MGIGDSLYVNFSKTTHFNYDPKCEELLERIKAVAKTEDYLMSTYIVSSFYRSFEFSRKKFRSS